MRSSLWWNDVFFITRPPILFYGISTWLYCQNMSKSISMSMGKEFGGEDQAYSICGLNDEFLLLLKIVSDWLQQRRDTGTSGPIFIAFIN